MHLCGAECGANAEDCIDDLETIHRVETDEVRPAHWKMMASVAAGTVLGMPYVSAGTFLAAWVEVSQWIAALHE